MGTLLEVPRGNPLAESTVPGSSQQSYGYPGTAEAVPFGVSKGSSGSDASTSSLAASLSSLLSSMAVGNGQAATSHDAHIGMASKSALAQAEPFSFFHSGATTSIWK